jgi:hypothetical protein
VSEDYGTDRSGTIPRSTEVPYPTPERGETGRKEGRQYVVGADVMGPQTRNGTNPGGPPASPFLTAVGGFRACRKTVVCVNGRGGLARW